MSAKEDGHQPNKEEKFVLVAIHTTSGSYPDQGHERVNEHQKLSVIVEKASRHLNITDTTNWIALAGERQLDLGSTYQDLALSGTIEIDWGPQEGGGGCA